MPTITGTTGNDTFTLEVNDRTTTTYNGGDGFDTVILNGTPYYDSFNDENIGLTSAGRAFENIEQLVFSESALIQIYGSSFSLPIYDFSDIEDVIDSNGNSNTLSIRWDPYQAGTAVHVIGSQTSDHIESEGDLSLDSILDGQAGDDLLEGGSGADTIIGGTGNDILTGESSYSYDKGVDRFVFGNGFGNDTITDFNTYQQVRDQFKSDVIDFSGISSVSSVSDLEIEGYVTGTRITVAGEGSIYIASMNVNAVLASAESWFTSSSVTATENGFDVSGIAAPEQVSLSVPRNDGTTMVAGDNLSSSTALVGTAGRDYIFGHAGDDNIEAGAGDDVVYGGEHNDILRGEDGNDVLYGQLGDDTLYGGTGDDSLYGNEGNDTLYGGQGNDRLYGGDGNDTISAQNGGNRIYGGDGNDTIYSSDDNGQRDFIYGGQGNDLIELYDRGNGSYNAGFGGEGDDTLYMTGGLQYVFGQGGADTFKFAEDITYNLGSSTDDWKDVARIRDFNISEGDVLDVSEIFDVVEFGDFAEIAWDPDSGDTEADKLNDISFRQLSNGANQLSVGGYEVALIYGDGLESQSLGVLVSNGTLVV